jgi:hypothetical protein
MPLLVLNAEVLVGERRSGRANAHLVDTVR